MSVQPAPATVGSACVGLCVGGAVGAGLGTNAGESVTGLVLVLGCESGPLQVVPAGSVTVSGQLVAWSEGWLVKLWAGPTAPERELGWGVSSVF